MCVNMTAMTDYAIKREGKQAICVIIYHVFWLTTTIRGCSWRKRAAEAVDAGHFSFHNDGTGTVVARSQKSPMSTIPSLESSPTFASSLTTFESPPSDFDLPPSEWTFADVLARLGGIPPERIRTYPAPGTATEQDVLDAETRSDRICELVDGILVEKPMASYESFLAIAIGHFLMSYLETRNLGVVLGEAGMLKIMPGLIRVPDVSFISWERMPEHRLPERRIYSLAPDLAVEVISKSNTEAEMQRKLHEYFTSGTLLVWYIYPETRTARAYVAEDRRQDIAPDGVLSGGEVLPGFELPLEKLFGWTERQRE
jgi:Uma2 family endonuclease